MSEPERTRLVACADELRRVHARLREALVVVRDGEVRVDDLLVYCAGFCAALDAHHRGEDRALFPALAAAEPALADVLDRLSEDHALLGTLLRDLRAAADAGESRAELERHLDGVAALMESHFRYEERVLLPALGSLSLAAPVEDVLGPL